MQQAPPQIGNEIMCEIATMTEGVKYHQAIIPANPVALMLIIIHFIIYEYSVFRLPIFILQSSKCRSRVHTEPSIWHHCACRCQGNRRSNQLGLHYFA